MTDEQPIVPPHSTEAEQSVLGGLMHDKGAWDQISDKITAKDFYRHDHTLIFQAIASLLESVQDAAVDPVTIGDTLTRRGLLEEAGGHAYLEALKRDAPGASNVSAYADVIRAAAVRRRLLEFGHRLRDLSPPARKRDRYGQRDDQQFMSVEEWLEYAEVEIGRISGRDRSSAKGMQPIKSLLSDAVDTIGARYEQDSHITGIPTGLDDLDKKTAGLHKGDLIIVAGRPSMGKTALAMCLAEHAALHAKVGCAVFSMEMPGEQLSLRLLSSIGRIDQSRVRSGQLVDEDWPRLTMAVTRLSEASIEIDDSPALTPTDMRSRLRRLQREHDIGLVIVDYLQLMQVANSGENRATEIAEISRGLKAMAKECGVAVVALSQLNRQLEARPNRRPVMSDLRESGSIEQDADLIVFVYRDEVYNPESPDAGTAELIIGKQRNGETGTVRSAFLGSFTRFENLAPDFDR